MSSVGQAHRCVRVAPVLHWSGRSTCNRRVYCSTATATGCRIGDPDVASKCSSCTPSSLHQPSQSRLEGGAFRASLLAPVSALVKANLNFLNGIVTGYPFPFYFLMAFFPRHQLTKSLLTNARCLIPFAVLYAVLLITSWTPESASLLFPGDMEQAMADMMAGKPGLYFVPTVGGICKLLSAPMASVSAWAHLQFIAFFCARYIWMDGLVKQVATVHSVLVCAVLPPLGFLSHIFTCFFMRKRRGGSDRSTGEGPAPSPATDRGWAVSTGGSGFYSTDRNAPPESESGGSSQMPLGAAVSNNGGPSANGASPSGAGNVTSGGGSDGKPVGSNWLSRRLEQRAETRRHSQHKWLTVLEPEYVDRSDEE